MYSCFYEIYHSIPWVALSHLYWDWLWSITPNYSHYEYNALGLYLTWYVINFWLNLSLGFWVYDLVVKSSFLVPRFISRLAYPRKILWLLLYVCWCTWYFLYNLQLAGVFCVEISIVGCSWSPDRLSVGPIVLHLSPSWTSYPSILTDFIVWCCLLSQRLLNYPFLLG